MDFKVNSANVLESYQGAGGRVVIPEGVRYIATAGVFDRNTVIETLVLPKSFCGFKENRPDSAEYLYEDEDGSLKAYNPNDVAWHERKRHSVDDKKRRFRDHGLPHLFSYEVDDGNENFACLDGVLYSKDFSAIIACPRKFSGRIVIDDHLRKIDLEAFGERVEPIELEYKGKVLTHMLLSVLVNRFRCLVKLYGPNVRSYDDQNHSFVGKTYRIVFIFPKFDTSKFFNMDALERVAMGICYDQDAYGPKALKYLASYLRSDRFLAYEEAKSLSLRAVCEYIEDLWQNWSLREYSRFDDHAPLKLLYNCVVHGKVSEVKKVIEEYSSYGLEYKISILLCLRYGTLNKLKCLIENGDVEDIFQSSPAFMDNLCLMLFPPAFESPYAQETQAKAKAKQEQKNQGNLQFLKDINEIFNLNIAIDVDVDLDYRPVRTSYRPLEWNSAATLPIGSKGEYHNAEVAPVTERIKMLRYLINNKRLHPYNLGQLLIASYIAPFDEIAQFLKSKRADVCHVYKCTCSSGNTRFFNLMLQWGSVHCISGVEQVLKELKDGGVNLCWDSSLSTDLLEHDGNMVRLMCTHFKIPKDVLWDAIETAVEKSNIAVFRSLVESVRLFSSQLFTELLELTISKDRPELTTILLEYKQSRRTKDRNSEESELSL